MMLELLKGSTVNRGAAIKHWQALHNCVLPARTLAFVHSVKNELRPAAMVAGCTLEMDVNQNESET